MINEQPKSIAQVSQADGSAPGLVDRNGESPPAARLNKALYEEHVLADKIVGLASATPHERFEAFALSVRSCSPDAGWIPRAPMRARTPSECITSRWNFSSGDRSPTMSQIFSWMPMPVAPPKRSTSIGWPSWNRRPMRDLAMEAWVAWQPAFWTP